jgi:hypothetical protein
MIVARGAFLAACSPGVNLRQAISADQTALAAGYGIALGGGLVGTGTRIHMFTRWGIPQSTIATSIVATAVVPAFSTWGLPVVILAFPVVLGTATSTELLVHNTLDKFSGCAIKFRRMFVGKLAGFAASAANVNPLVAILEL